MIIRRSIAFLIAVLLVAGLAGCKRPIPGSTQEPAVSPEAAEPFPAGGATDVLDQFYLFATQTAMATQGITTGVPQVLETGAIAPGSQLTPAAPGVVPTEAVVQPVVATAVPVIVPTATPGLPAKYTLKTGEFPYCIARRFNVDPGALLRANGLTTYSVYYAGMELQIPQNAAKFPGSRALKPHPATYTVRPGDTLASIACAFGDVDPEMIAFANSFGGNEKVAQGQVIQVP